MGSGAALLTAPCTVPDWGFAASELRLAAPESLISDLVACWGSRSRRGRVCAPPRPAREHVLTSGSGSAPLEARSPVSPPGGCAHPAVLGSSERPFPIRHPVSALQVCWREHQWVKGGAGRPLAAVSRVLISPLGVLETEIQGCFNLCFLEEVNLPRVGEA